MRLRKGGKRNETPYSIPNSDLGVVDSKDMTSLFDQQLWEILSAAMMIVVVAVIVYDWNNYKEN